MRARLSDPGHNLGRVLAALVGTGPVALAISVALAHVFPAPFEWRLLIGSYAAVPVWIALIWIALVARSGRRAWALLGCALAVSLAAIALGRGAP